MSTKRPRIRIINHRAGDASEQQGGDLLTVAWEKRQALTDAIAHAKKTVGIIPDIIQTSTQMMSAKRALAVARQEIDTALKLCLEQGSSK